MAILFRDVRVIDGLADRALEAMDVVVRDGRIEAVRPTAAAPSDAPPVDRVIDGRGRTLLPGLVDAHAHYTFDPEEGDLLVIGRRGDDEILSKARAHARRALEAGVTTARGAGSIRGLEWRLRDEIAAGTTPGPRLVAAGLAVGCAGGHGHAFGLEADGPEAITAAVGRVLREGADVLKVVASEAAMLTTTGLAPGAIVNGAPELTEEELRACVSTARSGGRRVMAHAQGSESVMRCARAGVDSVEHAWLADEAAIDVLAASGAWLVPTLVVTDVNRTLPGLTAIQRERQDLIERRHRASCEAAIRSGVPVAAGTDTGEVGVTADMVWREVALIRDHGASAMAAIRAGTSGGARLLGVDDQTGSIQAGGSADLILVDGDPLDDLRRLATPVLVLQGGRIVAGAPHVASSPTGMALPPEGPSA